MDSALDDFLKRFGNEEDPEKLKTQNRIAMPSEAVKIESKGLAELNTKGIDSIKGLSGKLENIPEEAKTSGLENLSGIASKGVDALPFAMETFSAFKGDQFDTSADSGGPKGAGGMAAMGAVNGFKTGTQIGGPLVGAGLAAVGAIAPLVGANSARKKWLENQKQANISESYFEKTKRANETAMENGLASMENMKALAQKQLGIIS